MSYGPKTIKRRGDWTVGRWEYEGARLEGTCKSGRNCSVEINGDTLTVNLEVNYGYGYGMSDVYVDIPLWVVRALLGEAPPEAVPAPREEGT